MSSILFTLPELYESYKDWVSKNPQRASDFETTAKWISYFIAGRINNSQVVSELVYSLSNLLVLFNDRIINNSQQLQPSEPQDNLKVWLTVLEYSEVFFELSAARLWGAKGKWLVIVCIQIFKCLSRMVLMYHYKENVMEHPAIPVLKRNGSELSVFNKEANSSSHLGSISFTLQHSGKVIRKVDSAPPVAFRNWKPIELTPSHSKQAVEQSVKDKQLIAETIYVVKPIVHLGSVACFGNNTWKPWLVSLLLDLYSLHLYRTCRLNDCNSLSPKQKMQMSRRTVGMLLYLLRSPFYDEHSKRFILGMLGVLSKRIPLAGLICNPLLQYLPFWQRTYFYMWSN